MLCRCLEFTQVILLQSSIFDFDSLVDNAVN
jgi:hypothetical protein